MNQTKKPKDLSVDMFTASIKCIPIILLLIIILIPIYISIYGVTSLIFAARKLVFGWWLIIPIIIAGIFTHEGLHALVFALCSRGFRDVHIGIQWDSVTPYAHYNKPIRALYYRIALLAPAIILGVIPILVGLVFHYGPAFILGLLFLLFSGGDILIMWLIRTVSNDTMVKDHADRAGCYVVREK